MIYLENVSPIPATNNIRTQLAGDSTLNIYRKGAPLSQILRTKLKISIDRVVRVGESEIFFFFLLLCLKVECILEGMYWCPRQTPHSTYCSSDYLYGFICILLNLSQILSSSLFVVYTNRRVFYGLALLEFG